MMARSSQTPSNIWAARSMVCDRHINLTTVADAALRYFTAGTFYI